MFELMSETKTAIAKPYHPAVFHMMRTGPHAEFVLDLGCGKNPYLFCNHLSNYVGLDIDINTLKTVLHNLTGTVLVCASGSSIPFKDGSFDLIICTEVLEHLQNPEETLAEMNRVLKDKGIAVISIPSLSLPQTIILWVAYRIGRISKKPYQSPDHVREYARFIVTPHFADISDFLAMIRREGFDVQNVVTVQPLYSNPKMLYDNLLSKIEKKFARVFSKNLFGHHTIFQIAKRTSNSP